MIKKQDISEDIELSIGILGVIALKYYQDYTYLFLRINKRIFKKATFFPLLWGVQENYNYRMRQKHLLVRENILETH